MLNEGSADMSVGISNDIMSVLTLRTVTLSPSSKCFNVSSVKYLPVNDIKNSKFMSKWSIIF